MAAFCQCQWLPTYYAMTTDEKYCPCRSALKTFEQLKWNFVEDAIFVYVRGPWGFQGIPSAYTHVSLCLWHYNCCIRVLVMLVQPHWHVLEVDCLLCTLQPCITLPRHTPSSTWAQIVSCWITESESDWFLCTSAGTCEMNTYHADLIQTWFTRPTWPRPKHHTAWPRLERCLCASAGTREKKYGTRAPEFLLHAPINRPRGTSHTPTSLASNPIYIKPVCFR